MAIRSVKKSWDSVRFCRRASHEARAGINARSAEIETDLAPISPGECLAITNRRCRETRLDFGEDDAAANLGSRTRPMSALPDFCDAFYGWQKTGKSRATKPSPSDNHACLQREPRANRSCLMDAGYETLSI